MCYKKIHEKAELATLFFLILMHSITTADVIFHYVCSSSFVALPSLQTVEPFSQLFSSLCLYIVEYLLDRFTTI